jgi:hypothetical protein
MTRIQEYAAEVRAISLQFIKANMPEAKMLVVDMCCDLPNDGHVSAWTQTKVASGLQTKFISECGFEKCLKRDATICMIIGEQHESGYWLSGKYKTYWLRPKA